MVSKIQVPLKSDKHEGLMTLNKFPLNLGYTNQKSADMDMFFNILTDLVEKRKLTVNDLMDSNTRLILEVRPMNRSSDIDNIIFTLKAVLDTLESSYVNICDGVITNIIFSNAHKGRKEHLGDRPFLHNDNIKNIPSIYAFYSGNSTKGYPYYNLFYTSDPKEYSELLQHALKAEVAAQENREAISEMYANRYTRR